jgi:hypothetical protein
MATWLGLNMTTFFWTARTQRWRKHTAIKCQLLFTSQCVITSQNSLCGISLLNFSRLWAEGLVNCFITLFWLHSSWRIVYWERGNGRWSLSQILSSSFLIKFNETVGPLFAWLRWEDIRRKRCTTLPEIDHWSPKWMYTSYHLTLHQLSAKRQNRTKYVKRALSDPCILTISDLSCSPYFKHWAAFHFGQSAVPC